MRGSARSSTTGPPTTCARHQGGDRRHMGIDRHRDGDSAPAWSPIGEIHRGRARTRFASRAPRMKECDREGTTTPYRRVNRQDGTPVARRGETADTARLLGMDFYFEGLDRRHRSNATRGGPRGGGGAPRIRPDRATAAHHRPRSHPAPPDRERRSSLSAARRGPRRRPGSHIPVTTGDGLPGHPAASNVAAVAAGGRPAARPPLAPASLWAISCPMAASRTTGKARKRLQEAGRAHGRSLVPFTSRAMAA